MVTITDTIGKEALEEYTSHGISETLQDTYQNAAVKENPLLFYNTQNIEQLVWPDTEEAQLTKRFLLPLMTHGTRHYIDNVDVEICALQVEKQILPIVIANNDYDNSYVCSPYAHYISLGLEFLHLVKNRFVRKFIEIFLTGLGKILKSGQVNRIIYINHSLFATDLHPPEINAQSLQSVTALLKEKYPQHAIAIRSINEVTTPQLQKDLKSSEFNLIASRQIYLTDTRDKELFKTRILKSDLKLWRERDYELLDASQLKSQQERILQLYTMLSIDYHSSLNPRLNTRFIKLLLDNDLLKIKALKKNDTIEGVVGYVEKNKVLTCPFFGYDKNSQEPNRLYRLLSTMLFIDAHHKDALFHQSAGASFYKTVRRAKGCQEFLGVYTKHLSFKQRFAWGVLKNVMNIASGPLMKKY